MWRFHDLHSRQVARALQYRARGVTQVDAHFTRDDVSQGGLAQPRRAEQEHMIERFAAHPCGGYENGELLANPFLPDVFVECLGSQGAFEGLFLFRCGRRGNHALDGGRGGEAVGFERHVRAGSMACACAAARPYAFDRARSAWRMPSETPRPGASCRIAARASRSL